MRLVLLESPYAGPTQEAIDEHIVYARAAMVDSIDRFEAPFASHLLYTQVLNDRVHGERERGLRMGELWGQRCDLVAFYVDLGLSAGMHRVLERTVREGRALDIRTIRRDYDAVHRVHVIARELARST